MSTTASPAPTGKKMSSGRSVAVVGDVKALGSALGARVRSAHHIDSLASCVVELVQNSVDAGASSIEVVINSATWSVKVSLPAAAPPSF